MSGEAYSARVAAFYRDDRLAGRPEGPGWVSAEVREPLSATHVRWHLRLGAGERVEVRYEVRGCPHTIATAAAFAAAVNGQLLASLDADIQALAAALGVPREKLGRLFVIQDAVRKAALLLRGQRP